MTDEKTKEVKERLRNLLPHIKLAANMAQLQMPEGTVRLAIVVKAHDGSGRITATFEFEEFLRDLEHLTTSREA